MIRKIRRATSSTDTVCLVIPKVLVQLLDMKPNQDVDITLKGGKLIITPIKETNEN